MKKVIAFLTSLIIIIFIAGCGSNTKKENVKENKNNTVSQNDSSGIVSSTPYEVKENESFRLQYKFNTGKSFKYRLISTSSTSQNVVSDSTTDNHMDQKVTRILEFKTISVEHDTIAILECTVTDINVNRTIDGKTTAYKSGENLDSTKLNQFIEYVGTLNNSFNVKISTHGDIIDIFNVDEFVNKFMQLSKMNKSLTNDEKASFQNNLKESLLRPLLTQIFRDLPNTDIKISSSWNTIVPPAQVMAFKLSYNNTFSLENIEKSNDDRIAVINGKSDIKIEGETKQVNRGVEYDFEKPVASAGGKLYFDIDRGLLYKSNTGTSLEIVFKSQMIGPKGLIKASTKRKVINSGIAELL